MEWKSPCQLNQLRLELICSVIQCHKYNLKFYRIWSSETFIQKMKDFFLLLLPMELLISMKKYLFLCLDLFRSDVYFVHNSFSLCLTFHSTEVNFCFYCDVIFVSDFHTQFYFFWSAILMYWKALDIFLWNVIIKSYIYTKSCVT